MSCHNHMGTETKKVNFVLLYYLGNRENKTLLLEADSVYNIKAGRWNSQN